MGPFGFVFFVSSSIVVCRLLILVEDFHRVKLVFGQYPTLARVSHFNAPLEQTNFFGTLTVGQLCLLVVKRQIWQGLINNENACRHVLYTLSAVNVSPAVSSSSYKGRIFPLRDPVLLRFFLLMVRMSIPDKRCLRRWLVAGTKAEMGSVAAPVGGSIANSCERTEQRLHYLTLGSQEANWTFQWA